MAAFLTYLLLFVTPVVVIPGIALRFEPPKVIFVEVLIELMLAYVIFSGQFSLKKVNRLLLTLVAGLFLLSLFHLIISPSKENLFGNIFRLQGTVLFWHFLILALIAQNIYFRLKEKAIFIASFIALGIGVLVFGSNRAGRLVGSLGEPNALGAVVVLILPFILLSFKSIWVRVIGVIGAIGVINFTESKSALIALGLELLFIALVKMKQGKQFLAWMVCLGLLAVSLILPILEQNYFYQTNTDPQNFRYEDRAEIWKIAINAGFNSPIYGSGINSIQEQIHTTAQKLNLNSQYQVIDSSHNILLDYWVWGGGLGLGLLGGLVILGIKNLIQKQMILEATVLIGLLTVLSFNPLTVSVIAAFWWAIGRSFANPHPDS